MQIKLERSARDLTAATGGVLFFVGLALLFSGAIFYPSFEWLMKLGVLVIEIGIGLIVFRVLLAISFCFFPKLRQLAPRQHFFVELNVKPVLRCSEPFLCEMSFSPNRSITIKNWSVTLIGVHEWQGEHELEGDRILQLANSQAPYTRFSEVDSVNLRCALFVPQDARPSIKKEEEEVRWFLEVKLNAFSARTPVTVISAEMGQGSPVP